ncbi:hypothetical protein T10_12776 [Trichinella papuae]|uniref:Uncharacterized protein n=1 Tax=Trichinella papuae TaxID=268474 RepID=A0A0V1MTR9_9BILA|nr:hypothetical protein T10_12776 [Trichinella papuae]
MQKASFLANYLTSRQMVVGLGKFKRLISQWTVNQKYSYAHISKSRMLADQKEEQQQQLEKAFRSS